MKKDKGLSKKSKKLNIFFIILVIILIFMIFCVININTIKNLITSNVSTSESEIKNLGVTDESETESWDSSIVSKIIVDTSMTDDDGDTITMYVPIPSGYTVSDVEGEMTVKEGLVIYEGDETVSEDYDARTTRNQFVWVPVNPSDVYWTDSDGSVYGIEYEFSETGRTANKTNREPIITGNLNYDYNLDYYKSNMDSILQLQADMQMDFKEMTKSIEKYGRVLYRKV